MGEVSTSKTDTGKIQEVGIEMNVMKEKKKEKTKNVES
jgi:hypothetical protein